MIVTGKEAVGYYCIATVGELGSSGIIFTEEVLKSVADRHEDVHFDNGKLWRKFGVGTIVKEKAMDKVDPISMVERKYQYGAKYRSNYDGDTIRFDIDLGLGQWSHNQIVRLYGVDTPEMRGTDEEKAKGLLAKTFVRGQLSSSYCEDIIIRTYKNKEDKSEWLAMVWYLMNTDSQARWICLNDELIKEGLAAGYKK